MPHESEKEILLNSNPQDAYVFLNDSLIGNTPIFIDHHFSALTMKKNGYEDLIIPSDQISSKEIFKLNFVGFEKDESFFSKDIFKYLTAGIILFGGATAYFKLKADHKFEEYESSGSIDLLDQTRKYDLISGLTFAALQINFGLLLYYFLIE